MAGDDHKTELPHEISDRFTRPFARFLKIEAGAGILLLFAALIALFAANSPWSATFLGFWETPLGLHFGPLDFTRSLRHWINDGLMTFFFFIIALELKRALVLGELRNPRTAALPFAAAIGGMVVPALIYIALMQGEAGAHGWGTVMATDTAFVIGCLVLFGSKIPPSLRLFLISLAIFDDVGAILILAIGYGSALNWLPLIGGVLGICAIVGLARFGIRSILFYLFAGVLVWFCFDASGIHTSIAGVLLGLITPAHAWVNDARLRAILGTLLRHPDGEHWSGDTIARHDLQQAGHAVKESLSPAERIEMELHPWVGMIVLPIFALANTGVVFTGFNFSEPVAIAIFAGLVIGKPLGVIGFSFVALHFRFATRQPSLRWSFLVAGAFLTGIGFTMSLFIADLAYTPQVLDAAKIGILASSACSALIGVLILYKVSSEPRVL